MNQIINYLEQHHSLFLAVSALVTILCSVAGVLFGAWISWRKLKKDRNELQQQVSELNIKRGQLEERVKTLEHDCSQAKAETQEVRAEKETCQDSAQQKEKELTTALEAAKEQTHKLEADKKRVARWTHKILSLEGQLWEKRCYSGTPKFQQLTDRKTPIISVLNPKGGVGKTTITAHLGAALVDRGYHPLLVDIDLQGSLSSMFLPLDTIVKRSKEGLLLQHFLNKATHHSKINLLEVITPILNDGCGIVATSDKMAYAELNLTMHWLLRLGRRDTRFLLRRALHQKRVTNQYDIILLDCPPLINTGCVNALAASDYVLVPTTPSKKSTERVPQLLKMLHDLGSRINPYIKVLGMVYNRTYSGSSLTELEQGSLDQLQEICKDQWGAPVHAFRTHIRQTTEVRDAETRFVPPTPNSELYETFQRLVLEIEERLPRECRRTTTAPV